ncbi:hypothetical protein [Phyllobacterium endophyticum]|uniref:hypothetical protein n=1 Tax=Phyllobacterium endophyticum TaxID=1149773 RepID=UPI0011C8768A|nr:hypothetical protein [Phyllobacterium endophyticum]TXR50449.1 hypothetical protein FVA77_03935 [Phyllobacterium endophyticum]
MAHQPVHYETVERLLDAITLTIGEDGMMSSFFFGKPGSRIHDRRMGTEIYYHQREMTLAVLYVRKHGPLYLRYLPIRKIWNMLQDFISENYWYLADECFGPRFKGTLAKNVSHATKERLSDAIATDSIFVPVTELSLFPLVSVKVTASFDSDAFFLAGDDGLTPARLPTGAQFPPIAEWDGKKHVTSAWLGVHSPAPAAAERQKAIILGAIALTPLPGYRYIFSGRTMFGGRCTIGSTATTSFGDSHTPPMMHDIIITERDHEWLGILADKLNRNEKALRRQMRALHYFYRAWPLDPSERFAPLCMSLDAIFGEAGSAAQAIIDSVRSVVGSHVEDARLRKLMDLRAAVLHGGAPEVYDSSKYDEYYEAYGTDPIREMELVVAHCLRARVFDFKLIEHDDPNADVIRQAQSVGRFPPNLRLASILDATA